MTRRTKLLTFGAVALVAIVAVGAGLAWYLSRDTAPHPQPITNERPATAITQWLGTLGTIRDAVLGLPPIPSVVWAGGAAVLDEAAKRIVELPGVLGLDV